MPGLDVILAEALGSENNGRNQAQVIINEIVKKAVGGDLRAAELLLDRAYGKAKQQTDITTGGEPIKGFESLADAFWADVIPKNDKP